MGLVSISHVVCGVKTILANHSRVTHALGNDPLRWADDAVRLLDPELGGGSWQNGHLPANSNTRRLKTDPG